MPSNIQQIQATFNPLEDRMLIKLHTGDQSLQAWITRRYLKLLIPALQGIHPYTRQPLFTAKKQALVEMSSQKIQQEGNFDAAYEEPENATKPLGDVPILLAKISFTALDTDHPQLLLEPNEGLGIALSYQPELMGALRKILEQALESADWSLELDPILAYPEKITLQ